MIALITTSHRSCIAPDSSDALMDECERMEEELGAWLTSRAAMLKARCDARTGFHFERDFRPSFWRALIHIWATSPGARKTYSEEARAGLVAAIYSMDPRAVMSLAHGIQEESISGKASEEAA